MHFKERTECGKDGLFDRACECHHSVQDSSEVQRSRNIRGTCVEKALLDLGANVNLLPYSVYKQLGLGELKPTNIPLSLIDRALLKMFWCRWTNSTT